ncbi:MAG: hypothetical protein EOO01_04040 [Chitinophagaceae bacterium]|nr:MAG: hypothetical protein EOO01_04040 [Chitinophagaceae bacterium]
MFDKLFGWARKKDPDPLIPFGRYSDNNKSVQKVQRWSDAEEHFKAKEFMQCLDAFFEYLLDEDQQNVVVNRDNGTIEFMIYQGSKVVRGKIDNEKIIAEAAIARMQEPSIPVMRRLLEMGFNLYYSRYALKEDKIMMLFGSDIITASPNKLYYGLKELATRADKQDDLLISEFKFLEPQDTAHVEQVPETEKDIKYKFLQKWINETLEYINTLEADKFSGGISYMLLSLVFRIDYLVSPEGKLLSELEKIASSYYSKDDKSSPERNPVMIEGFKKLLAKTRDEVSSHFFRSRYTFAIVVPNSMKTVNEAIMTAVQNAQWYRDNNYPVIANKVMEYGFAFCQFSYSMPKPLSDLFALFMQVNYSDYFSALGFGTNYYNEDENQFDGDAIEDRVDAIIELWKPKYPSLSFKTKKLKFESLVNFNQSFLQEVSELNFD